MTEATRILSAIEQGDPHAAEELLPLVYEELRRLAAHKLAQETPGHTLQTTSLVHEAYLRLVDVEKVQHWDSRGHFFAAAAEAMRRILIDNARRKKRLKRGGSRKRLDLKSADLATLAPPEELLIIDESLSKLAAEDPKAGQLVKLHYFAGLSVEDAGKLLGLARSTAYEHWAYAKAWLHYELYGRQETHADKPAGSQKRR
jgi:RNA polymerase sigma factor (TIGR02999 family)